MSDEIIPMKYPKSLSNTIIALVFLIVPMQSLAVDLNYKGSFRLLGTTSFNPDNDILYPNDNDSLSAIVARGIISGSITRWLDINVNVVQDMSHFSQPPLSGAFVTAGNVSPTFRHPDLEWEYLKREEKSDQNTGTLSLDHASLTFSLEMLDVIVGRQPINLATCFFLKPNDFFQPFAPQAFNTIYKAGVDGIHAKYFIGMLSEISLIAVAGYDDNEFEWDKSAVLAKGSTSWHGYRLEAIGGKVDGRYIAGGGVQGEIGFLGVRGEAHYALPDNDIHPQMDNYFQIAVGIDRKWQNSLHLFLEYLYRENGVSDPDDYAQAFMADEMNAQSFVARHYAVAAARYELHPLLNWENNVMINLDDSSFIGSSFIRYSIADEADFVGGIMIPIGESPGIREIGGVKIADIESEYGTQPASVYAEVRFFF